MITLQSSINQMSDLDYFARPEVSNSDLTKLQNDLSHKVHFDPIDAYAFGSLIDAMITEPERIDWFLRTIESKPLYGERSEKEQRDWDHALKMNRAFKDNENAVRLLKGASFQKISVAKRDMNWNGVSFSLDCRCKWDWFGHISGDIKSTVATTQKQFLAACHYFGYFRSRAWYMDLENTDRDIIIGISKKNYKLFFIPITRGGELYELGKSQYLDLAMKYWVLRDKI